MATEQQLQNRKRLIEALRSELPQRFAWDFALVRQQRGCGYVGCAIGLAHEIGLIGYPGRQDCAEAVGLSDAVARKIFMPVETAQRQIAYGYGVPYDKVTPQMVADKLTATLP